MPEKLFEPMVFVDLETTGATGTVDRITEIGIVEVNEEGEVREWSSLVNPQTTIPPFIQNLTGITDAMVAEAPDIVAVGRRFHKFAEGAVLVAHNAPFDMDFLRRKQILIQRAFDNPVLDTVLMSAMVFGGAEDHSLDGLTHRLGITIPEEARHTALGDTVATADAFLKLLAMLRAQGMQTFGDVLSELRRRGADMRTLNV